MDITATINVHHNAERHRYELLDGDKVIGKAHWLSYVGESGPERIFFHTTVDENYRDRGLAGELSRFALEDTIAAGMKVVPVCPFFKVFIRKHPEFQQHAVPVQPHHLEAVAAAGR